MIDCSADLPFISLDVTSYVYESMSMNLFMDVIGGIIQTRISPPISCRCNRYKKCILISK